MSQKASTLKGVLTRYQWHCGDQIGDRVEDDRLDAFHRYVHHHDACHLHAFELQRKRKKDRHELNSVNRVNVTRSE